MPLGNEVQLVHSTAAPGRQWPATWNWERTAPSGNPCRGPVGGEPRRGIIAITRICQDLFLGFTGIYCDLLRFSLPRKSEKPGRSGKIWKHVENLEKEAGCHGKSRCQLWHLNPEISLTGKIARNSKNRLSTFTS